MTITLRAARRGTHGLYEVHATIFPCHEDFPNVRDCHLQRFAIDTGCSWTTTPRDTYLGAPLARTHQATVADGREVPCGEARTHLIFADGAELMPLTIDASVNLEGEPGTRGLLGLDLIERLAVDGDGALVTIRDAQMSFPTHLYPRACACERVIADDPAGAWTELAFYAQPWLKRSALADAARSEVL